MAVAQRFLDAGRIPADVQGFPLSWAVIWSLIVDLISHIKMHLSWGGKVVRGKAFILVIAPFIALWPYGKAAAGSFDMQLFGHHIVITKGSDSQDSLKIDDREVLKDYYVDIDEMHVIDGMAVAVGTSSAGGNACEGSPFVVSFPKRQNHGLMVRSIVAFRSPSERRIANSLSQHPRRRTNLVRNGSGRPAMVSKKSRAIPSLLIRQRAGTN
ncbi:hypothetical protein ACC786_11365 [Rhizobium ruizarguesonis]|uniref:hypothetical protein n=1 Tax=Rhizobium ruizarguesonis TaxID=2081791 RepID=UPI0013EE5CD6|nr:hypothetical protein [Rhizobium ruizarguesonis]